jgi:hypothetical protein
MISTIMAGLGLLILSGIAKTYISFMLFAEFSHHSRKKNS